MQKKRTAFPSNYFKIKIIFSSLCLILLLCVSALIVIFSPLHKKIPPSTPAGEANFAREDYPFILKNYPNFHWRNPGQFNATVSDGIGYDPTFQASGTGDEAYPDLFNALEGLNESNIRVAYLDANNEWVLVPFQIDQVGWTNIWQIQDLNHYRGLDTRMFGWIPGDTRPGIGWLNGDPVTSCGTSDQNGQVQWYPTPIHTYVSKLQPDGNYTNEEVNIDSTLAQDLVNVYEGVKTSFPASGWNYSGDGTEAYIHLISEPDTSVTVAETIFIGDTWFKDPTICGDPTIEAAFNYEQINGALDKDDELVFYAYPGQKAPNNNWWNANYFPHRFALEIVDPVDGWQSWMYIYYNNHSAYNPITNTSAINLGAPTFTTPIKDYINWDPHSMNITTDYYQISINENNPSLLDSAKILGESDGQEFLTSFMKNYGFGKIYSGLALETKSVGCEGTWYHWNMLDSQNWTELICTIDNPSIWYLGIPEDTSNPNRNVVTSPQYYYGSLCYNRRGQYGIPADANLFTDWEAFGDRQAVIDGPCRVILYLQQYLMAGMLTHYDSPPIDDWLDFFVSYNDGPQIYYSRMQLSPSTMTSIPYFGGEHNLNLQYLYMQCGNLDNAIRGDFKLTAAVEWSGSPDGVDDKIPTFNWSDTYGWSKLGGLTPNTTSYNILGSCILDGNNGVGDFYVSEGDPVWGYGAYVPPAQNLNIGDWFMLTSETHGGIWIYIPRRELLEIRDNNGDLRTNAPNASLKMYYRDDPYQAEFGFCLENLSEPTYLTWPLPAEATSSPYSFMMVYGNFTDSDIAIGHKLYLYYHFPIDEITNFTHETYQPPLGPLEPTIPLVGRNLFIIEFICGIILNGITIKIIKIEEKR